MTPDERPGPNRVAHKVAEALPILIAEREAEKDKARRKLLSSRIRASRVLLAWCRTRAGYDAKIGE